MPLNSAEALILEQHGERIQRAEGQITALTGTVSSMKVDVDYVKKTVDDGFCRTDEALGRLESAMQSHAVSSATRQDAIMAKLQAADNQTALQAATSAGKKDLLQTAAKPLVIGGAAVAGGLLAKLGEWILSLILG